MSGRMLNKIASWIGGYDMFISYRHSDATKAYATQLEEILEAKGLMVFRDESEEEAGVPLHVFVKRACSARTLVVLAAPGVFGSNNVREELSGYLRRRMDKWYRRPFSRIVSINVDQTLSKAPPDDDEWNRLSDFVYIPETLEAFESRTPDPEVIERLSRAGSFMKSWQRFLVVALVTAVTIFSSAAGASVYLNSTVRKLAGAEADLEDTRRKAAALDSSRRDLERSNRRLDTSNRRLDARNRGLQASTDSLVRAGEKLDRENQVLLSRNDELAAQGDRLRRQANDLQREAAELQRQASGLRETGRMLQLRIAAMNQLEHEPLVAYRLAAEAYRLSPVAENREVILASLSKLDLMYTHRRGNYSVEDVRAPYILLSAKGATDGSKEFSVFDMRTAHVTPARVDAGRAWIVSLDATWRIVGRRVAGSGSSAVVTYQLWDHEGRPLGEPVQGRSWGGPEFVGTSTVRIPLPGGASVLLWDVAENARQVIHQETGDSSASRFRGGWGALATRSDRSAAAHHDAGLILVDEAGRPKRDSYTPVSFDSSPFSSAASWSSDDGYLALDYLGRKRLGVWDPAKASFVWLTPDGWIVERYAWSPAGHWLAFSGRTENDVDVTVEVVDAAAPESSRKVVHRGAVPINGMTFLAGGEQLAVSDQEGNISIIRIADGQVLARGRHQDVNRLFAAGATLYSSSPKDLRVWGARVAPARHWLFQSSGGRVYGAGGAADPAWTWLAVPYVDQDSLPGVELRSVRDGTKRQLDAPAGTNLEIEFSADGRWLVVETLDTLRIIDTRSWSHHDFALQQNDRQFISLRSAGDTIYAHVLGHDWASNTSSEFDYVIVLEADRPRMVRRVHADEDPAGPPDRNAILSLSRGWDYGTLYRYRSAGISLASNSGWAYYTKCRDQPLGASDCDIQFMPAGVEKLMNLYDPLLWNPTAGELAEWTPQDPSDGA